MRSEQEVIDKIEHSLGDIVHRLQNEMDASLIKMDSDLVFDSGALRSKSGSFDSYLGVCNRLGIEIDELLDGSYSVELIKSRLSFADDLGDRYLNPEFQLSKLRSLQGLLDYVQIKRGSKGVSQICSALGISSIQEGDPNQMISTKLMGDALEAMKLVGFSRSELMGAGKSTIAVTLRSPLGKTMSSYLSCRDLFESIHCELRGNWDHLFENQLVSLSDYNCVVRISPKNFARDLFSSHVICSKPTCDFKMGVYAGFTVPIYNQFARVKESICMYEGGPYCEYFVDWSHLMRLVPTEQ